MSVLNFFFGNRNASKHKKPVNPRSRRAARGAMTEALEARVLYSTYTVTSLAEYPSTSHKYTGTLPWAVQQVNADGAANHGPDTINFATGLAGTITLKNGPLTLSAGNTTIDGPGAALLTISGNEAGSIFVLDNGVTAAISGLTLTDATNTAIQDIRDRLQITLTNVTISYSSGDIGGGLEAGGPANVINCTFTNDSADPSGGGGTGGGICNFGDGLLYVKGSTFSSDTSSYEGGAIANNEGASLVAVNSTFIGDSSGSGGGIFNFGAASVESCTLAADGAASAGGGIFNNTGLLNVYGCTLALDSAPSGGGIFNDGTLLVTDSTLWKNDATGENDSVDSGGAIESTGLNPAVATIANSTIYQNSAASGGGVCNSLASALTLDNTIVAGDFASNGDDDVQGAVIASSSYNLIGSGNGLSGISNGKNGNQVGANPMLGPLGYYGGPTATFEPLPGSPAINRGSVALLSGLTMDQRGFARTINGMVDIGAVEVG